MQFFNNRSWFQSKNSDKKPVNKTEPDDPYEGTELQHHCGVKEDGFVHHRAALVRGETF